MKNIKLILEDFKTVAPEQLSFLGKMGFRRALELEETTSAFGTIVYIGVNVGFEFSFDVRDECIGAEVIKVKDGALWPNIKGGYSSGIFGHLVKHESLRGSGRAPSEDESEEVKTSSEMMRRKIDAEIYILKNFGQTLLQDKPGSLPNK